MILTEEERYQIRRLANRRDSTTEDALSHVDACELLSYVERMLPVVDILTEMAAALNRRPTFTEAMAVALREIIAKAEATPDDQ